jgi:tetratricopeptide (TPR) repeat protein
MKENKSIRKEIPVEKYEPKQDNLINKAQEIIDKKGKVILIVSVVVIVLTAALFYYRSASADAEIENREKAATAIARVLPFIQQQQYQRALDGEPNMQIRGEQIIGLVDIVKKFDGTDQAYLAAFYAGDAYLKLNDPENAEKYFDIALSSSSDVIIEGAYSGLGRIQEMKGNMAKAAEMYENAANSTNLESSKEKFLIYAATSFEKAGNSDKAGELYKEILSIGKGKYESMAKSGLLRLGMKIE